MAKIQLEYRHVTVGQPLPFELVDGTGQVLLKYGYVIQSEAQLDRLIERGAFFEAPEEETSSSQQTMEEKVSPHVRSRELFEAFAQLIDREQPDYGGLPGIAGGIQELCESNGDLALAGILLHKTGRYSLRHSFHAAVLSEMLLKRLEHPPEDRRHAVAGALSMNLCMLALQDELYAQNTPLTTEQKLALVTHPQKAGQALRERGIESPVWLGVVENHHEMIDGSGYARRLRKEDLGIESQAVSLADRFCAMVSERGYRAGMPPGAATKTLLEQQSATIDPLLVTAFVKEVGIYPPGTLVTLANGEVGVVARRLLNPAHPLVRSLRSASGIRYAEPPKRVTSKPAHAIKEGLDSDALKGFDIELVWQALLLDDTTGEEAAAE